MKRIMLVLTVAALMLAMTVTGALPALATHNGPSQPDCDWYRMSNRNVDSDLWGYWCYWEDDGWYLYYLWESGRGYISLY